MSQLHLSDEILMAFADGELDEHVAAAVERAMLDDPSITGRVVDFLRSHRLTRSAFSREATFDVPPELRAAVYAQISAFETIGNQTVEPGSSEDSSSTQGMKRLLSSISLVAAAAAIMIAAIGYIAWRQVMPSRNVSGMIARLGDPHLQDVLNESASGQDVMLPAGRVRVISTYRLANGSLCREFLIQASSGKANAVACLDEGWNVTFALASAATNAAYVPSDGGDLVSAYLQKLGAGEPLVDSAETKALRDNIR